MAKTGAMHIKVEGVEKAVRDIAATELRKRGALAMALGKTLLQGQKEMKTLLSQQGSGRVYGNHRASAPGEPPATDKGIYRASWHIRTDLNALGGDLYTQQERAQALEYGRKDGTLAPRPHAGPIAEKMKGEWVKNAKGALAE